MGYRKVTRAKALDMAKQAGLSKKSRYRLQLRIDMAEHAVKLLISWTLKDKRKARLLA